MLKAPSGEISTETIQHSEDKPSVRRTADKWTVMPNPYEIDKDNGCVVWKRRNWSPRNPDDDIIVSTHRERYTDYSITTNSIQHTVDSDRSHNVQQPPMPEPPPLDMNLDELFKRWCGGSQVGINAEHFGAAVKIIEKKLDAAAYRAMWEKAYYYPETKQHDDFGRQITNLPANDRTAFNMQLQYCPVVT